MMKSVLSFGLVSIPVEIQNTVAPNGGMCWLSPQGNRVSVEYVDSVTGERLVRNQLLHGVEVIKEKYVTFTNAELKALLDDRGNTILIQQVIPIRALSLHGVEKSYYLTPHKIHKPYRLLHSCLKSSNRAAVGKWHTRGKDHLVLLHPTPSSLVMLQLHYQTELREVCFSFAKGSEPNRQEVALANELLDRLASDGLDVASYQDEYAQRLRAAVEAKQAGNPDLATLLRKSLKGKHEGRAKGRQSRAGGRRR